MELMLRFAWHLAASFGRDPRVTALLSATSVHILPVINPDGLVAHSRNNANNADLNRNFPLTKFPYGAAPCSPTQAAPLPTPSRAASLFGGLPSLALSPPALASLFTSLTG
jgi:hypothetical protein